MRRSNDAVGTPPNSHSETRLQRGLNVLETLSARTIMWRSSGLSYQEEEVSDAIASGDFHKAFIPLKIIRDYYRGIHTTYESNDDEHHILVRDARTQSDQFKGITYQCEANYYKYVQLGLNYLSGILVLLEIENKRRLENNLRPFINIEAARADLIKYAQAFYKDITPNNPNDKKQQKDAESKARRKYGRFFHDVIKPFYHAYRLQLDNEALEEELQLGRNFSNMKISPYIIATIARHKVHSELQERTGGLDYLDAVELELPMIELTNEQKRLYVDRKKENWYLGQSDIAQGLIDFFIEKILNGAMIPAQLIYHLIGTRNGYEKLTALINPYNEQLGKFEKYKVLNSTYHAGTQGHLLKLPKFSKDKNLAEAARETAVNSTVTQLRELTDADHLSINTLVTPLGRLTRENKIKKQIKSATHRSSPALGNLKHEVSFSNLPLNYMRRLGRRNITGIEELSNIASDFLEKSPNNGLSHNDLILEYLSNKNGSLQAAPAPEILELFFCLSCLEEILDKRSSFTDSKNYNLEIAAQANLLVGLLNAVQKDVYYVLISGCFSGQDRGGMLSTHTSNEAIIQHLMIESKSDRITDKQADLIQVTQALAGHTGEMAGNAGTGFGGEGIKLISADIIPDYYPNTAKTHLLSETGAFNERLPRNPNRPFYKKKTFWIAAAAAGTGIGLIATCIIAYRAYKKRLGKHPYRKPTPKTVLTMPHRTRNGEPDDLPFRFTKDNITPVATKRPVPAKRQMNDRNSLKALEAAWQGKKGNQTTLGKRNKDPRTKADRMKLHTTRRNFR